MEAKRIAVLKRAQTAAARISAVVLPSVLYTTEDGKIQKSRPHPLSLTKPTEAHIYKLEAAARLPVANLRLTLSWYLLKPAKNLAFLKWTKKRFRLLTWMNRLGLLLGMITFALPRQYAPFLVPPACLLAAPASCCSYAMLSTDLLRILVQQYEFWFFTIVNLTTWIVLATLCQDSRAIFLAVVCIDTELVVLMDANFRTFVPAVRTCAGALPVLVVLAILVILQQIDLPPHQARLICLGKLHLEPAEIFLNAILTLLLFLLRKVYNKRKRLRKYHASSRVVRCTILRCVLVMKPLSSHSAVQAADAKPLRREYGTSVVLKKLGITAQKMYPGIKSGRTLNCRQQLSLVSLRLSTIDVCKTLYPRWWTAQNAIRPHHLAIFYSIGALGLLLSGCAMLIPGSQADEAFVGLSETWIVVIPFLGFACTSAFCAAFACAYQRDLVRAMFRNFGFLFPSVQFSLACVCLADAMRWDNRCWAIASYCLWFHWIMSLDALTPPTRKQLRFRKQLAVPAVIAVWIGMLSVMYAIIIASPTLSDRELMRIRIGLKEITVGTKSILLNRVVTILVWTFRLMWQILYACEAELVLLHGTLDYYCPFDSFTGSARGTSLKAVVPVTGARQDSDGSMALLPPTELSNGRRRSSFQRALRRASSHRVAPVHIPLRPSVARLPPIPPEVLREIRSRFNEPLTTPVLATDVPSRTGRL